MISLSFKSLARVHVDYWTSADQLYEPEDGPSPGQIHSANLPRFPELVALMLEGCMLQPAARKSIEQEGTKIWVRHRKTTSGTWR